MRVEVERAAEPRLRRSRRCRDSARSCRGGRRRWRRAARAGASARRRPAPRRSGRCATSAQASTSSPTTEGRTARAARASRSDSRRRIPWSIRKSAVSRSVSTPFATSIRSIAPTTSYCSLRLGGHDLRLRGDRRAGRRDAGGESPRSPGAGARSPSRCGRGRARLARARRVRARSRADGQRELEGGGGAVDATHRPFELAAARRRVQAVASGRPIDASRASSIASIAPATSPVSSRAYETLEYEDVFGFSAAIRSNAANASS